MDGHPPSFEPIAPRVGPPPVAGLNRRLIYGIVGGAALALVAILLYASGSPKPKHRATYEHDTRAIPSQGLPEFLTLGPKGYNDLRKSVGVHPQVAEASVAPEPPSPPPPTEPPPPTPTTKPATQAKVVPRETPKPPLPKKNWLSEGSGQAAPQISAEAQTQAVQAALKGQAVDKLITPATWARPKDPTRVLYPSQLIRGQLMGDVNSQHPGVLRIRVNEQVEDKFGQRRVLIPQYTILMAVQDGKIQFGEDRLPVTIGQAEFPDGTVLSMAKAKAADTQGANGLEGKVDNRWGHLLLSAGLSAILSIGTRVPAGSQDGFAPTIGQDVAQNAGQSINRTGQQVVQRELDVKPIFRAKAGEPVTIQLTEVLSLQTPPVAVEK